MRAWHGFHQPPRSGQGGSGAILGCGCLGSNRKSHALAYPTGMSMTDHHTATTDHRDALAARFSHRVLLAAPKTLTIPIISLQAEAGRLRWEIWSVTEKDEAGPLDKQAYGHLRKGTYGSYRFVTTRHRKDLRTACYAPWLAFGSEADAERFVTDHPRYGVSNLLALATRKKATIEHDLSQGLSKGRYNLSEFGEELRYQRARLFVTSVDELNRLSMAIASLKELHTAIIAIPGGTLIG